MFERYTEKARRVIFFARYEASNYGSPYIETQHVLMGLLREDAALVARFKIDPEKARKRIDDSTVINEKTSTTVDLPLSNESKRVLAYAAEEAEIVSHRHIGTGHLLLGLMREKNSLAALILSEAGLSLDPVRDQVRMMIDDDAPRRGPLDRHVFVEYVSADAVVGTTQLTVLPRAGDEISIGGKSGGTYVVETVRFVLTQSPVVTYPATKELAKVQVVVRSK